MTELLFKGKEFVYNHHLAVPHRPLVIDADKSVGKPDLAGNLIIQGDNLHALKALLPIYGGKVDCIFIDPPYNTGNESWSYNDRVNAPMIKEWLNDNPVGVEDGLRHDKRCAMMWPRLKLLHELLAEDGSFWMTLDDNEAHRGKLLMDEIFGAENFVGELIRKTKSTTNDAKSGFNIQHEVCLIYAQVKENIILSGEEKNFSNYTNPDSNSNGPWVSSDPSARTGDVRFPIINPNTERTDYPPEGRCWAFSEARFHEHVASGKIKFKKAYGNNERGFIYKRYLSEVKSDKHLVNSLFASDNAFMNQVATKEAIALFGKSVTDYPKPLSYVKKIIQYATSSDALILDSFAGSGTTAHAVLKANAEDGGNRKFIMVEMEDDIADPVTAERIRRVINGYRFNGTQKTELHREKLTFNKLKKGDISPDSIEKIVQLYGKKFNRISGDVSNSDVVIFGEDDVEKRIEGLGGSFTYCTLGEPIDLGRILSGKTLPAYQDLAPVLFHMATNETLNPANIKADDFYIGASLHDHVWMIYRPDLDWLKSDDAALTLSRANAIFQTDPAKRHLVFAPARFVSEKVLKEEKINVAFVPFPDSLYQIVREG